MRFVNNIWKIMENKDFAVFILTNGRPDNVKTYQTLRKCGYTGKIYLIVDNQDKSIDKYIENYGIKKIKIFDKKKMADNVDEGNNFDNTKVIIHARNACFEIANEIGVKYFVQFDDDYYYFGFRYDTGARMIKNLDKVFDSMLDFYKNSTIKSICFSQGGDHIGGFSGIKLKRKAMNSFFCSTERPFQFVGSINEDVNTYTTLGSRGDIFFTFTNIQLDQKDTQTNNGGMTDQYALSGTYVKSFHSVMMHPSGVKISMMNSNNPRLHHLIKWNNTTPLILNAKCKKL
jgi:hypothetical protein